MFTPEIFGICLSFVIKKQGILLNWAAANCNASGVFMPHFALRVAA